VIPAVRTEPARRCAAVLLLLAAGWARAQDAPRLLAEEASGTVPVSDETQLTVERIRGQIQVIGGAKDRLDYSSETGGEAKTPLPLALWLGGGVFRLVPPEGAREVPGVLKVWVPPGMKVDLRLDGATISVYHVKSEVEVRGQRDSLLVMGVDQSLVVEMDDGSANVSSVEGKIRMSGRNLAATVTDVRGAVSLKMTGGVATVRGLQGDLDGDFENLGVTVDGAQGICRLHVRQGQVDLRDLGAGADLLLSGSPLKLENSKGPISIETDRTVQFKSLESALRVTAFGGTVRGSHNDGSVEVKGTGASGVEIDSVSGSVLVTGAALKTHLSDIGGEVTVRTSSAPIQVNKVGGPLTIEIENANLDARELSGDVDVKSAHGKVRLSDLNGAVKIEANGPEVEANWTSLAATADSSIRNDGGGVLVTFGPNAGCRVEAESTGGKIEMEGLPGVEMGEGGTVAKGIVTYKERPIVKIVASGDVRLVGSEIEEKDKP
jgi:hypothetical protein